MSLDMKRWPIEDFIDALGDDIQLLIPQEEEESHNFSAFIVLMRNSQATRDMLDDWWSLRDQCPFLLWDDQGRMRGQAVRHGWPGTTDCLESQFCNQPHPGGAEANWYDFVVCLEIDYSRPDFWGDGDTGLGFNAQFGIADYLPRLMEKPFIAHFKPTYDPWFLQWQHAVAVLLPGYMKGMAQCPSAVVSDHLPVLQEVANTELWGAAADDEVLMMTRGEPVPALNLDFTAPLGTHTFWQFGTESSHEACFAAVPGSMGTVFAGQELEPALQRIRFTYIRHPVDTVLSLYVEYVTAVESQLATMRNLHTRFLYPHDVDEWLPWEFGDDGCSGYAADETFIEDTEAEMYKAAWFFVGRLMSYHYFGVHEEAEASRALLHVALSPDATRSSAIVPASTTSTTELVATASSLRGAQGRASAQSPQRQQQHHSAQHDSSAQNHSTEHHHSAQHQSAQHYGAEPLREDGGSSGLHLKFRTSAQQQRLLAQLRANEALVQHVTKFNAMDMIFYEAAVREFRRRCGIFGIEVRSGRQAKPAASV
ncbi:hypothetical protein JKP88DRAFT_287218 [Tribonema minus]|uniref:Uncharacterized protein n=1 Tax=Tribonema minus TaxID=303371 RepID=A0A835Z9A1_9STRA|nr:hypothetical protein JKP88DRAFT_287218 [Tribonema minus]